MQSNKVFESPISDALYSAWMTGLRVVGRALLHTGYRYSVEGIEGVPAVGGVLVVANHVSFHDWLFVGASLSRTPRFVMHHHHFRYPVLRQFLEASRVIPIAPRKEDPERCDRALEEIDAALARGELVVISPEGNITPDGHLQEFRPGVERIVSKRPVPVVPVALHGLWGSFFSRISGPPMSGFPKRFRAKVRVEVGQAINPDEVSTSLLRERIAAMLGDEA